MGQRGLVKQLAKEYLTGRRVASRSNNHDIDNDNDDDDNGAAYVSRLWLHRAAAYVEPGCCLNRMCYCTPSQREVCLGSSEVTDNMNMMNTSSTSSSVSARGHFHGSAAWFYAIPVTKEHAELFRATFGGDAPLTSGEVRRLERMENEWIKLASLGGGGGRKN